MKKILIAITTITSLAACSHYKPVEIFHYKRTDTAKWKSDNEMCLSMLKQRMKEENFDDNLTIAYTARKNDLDAYIVFDSVGFSEVYVYDPKKTTAEKDYMKQLGITPGIR